jgi:flagellar L-ring protein precursor FlgH
MRIAWIFAVLTAIAGTPGYAAPKAAKSGKGEPSPPSKIDRILDQLKAQPRATTATGSTYDPNGRLAELSRDLRAAHVDDLVTVVIADHVSASSTGTSATQRKSALDAGISALGGITKATGPLANLANMTGSSSLNGQGQTNRTIDLTATLTARVLGVLPNGTMIIEGNKEVQINSEKQHVTLRGLVRWDDISPTNQISSNSIAELEVLIDGRGVVNDALKRPNFLYRLLMGVLPF